MSPSQKAFNREPSLGSRKSTSEKPKDSRQRNETHSQQGSVASKSKRCADQHVPRRGRRIGAFAPREQNATRTARRSRSRPEAGDEDEPVVAGEAEPPNSVQVEAQAEAQEAAARRL